MSEISRERRLEILESLGSTVCGACGKSKRFKMSHCSKCYFALPQKMRNDLYQSFGSGYEEAFEESLRFLKQSA